MRVAASMVVAVVVALSAGCGVGSPEGIAAPVASPSPADTSGCGILDQTFARTTFGNAGITATPKPTEDFQGGKNYQCDYRASGFTLLLGVRVFETAVSAQDVLAAGMRNRQPLVPVTGVGDATAYAIVGARTGIPGVVQYVAVRRAGSTMYVVSLIGTQVPDFESAYATAARKALEGP